MGAALVLLLVALGALAAGVLIGRYYVPDDRQLRRTARHSKAYMRALSHLIARDHETAVAELRAVVEESVDDVEPYFALGAMFRTRGEHERAIRVHQALALREKDRRKNRQRALYELGLDFRSAGMPRRATKAMEEVLLEEPGHDHALRVLAALYEEQSRFHEAADLWSRLARRTDDDTSEREHHLLVAAAQLALGRDELDAARSLLKTAGKSEESAHFYTAAAELAAARGNHAGAKERLKQALIAEPALAPHLVPGLIAAERMLGDGPGAGGTLRDDMDDEPAARVSAQLAAVKVPDALLGVETSLALAGDGAAAAEPVALPPGAAAIALALPGSHTIVETPEGVALVPVVQPPRSVAERVLATLTEVEAQTGPRLELDLVRASLVPPADEAARKTIANELIVRFPDALAARVATARLAIAGGSTSEIQAALEVLVSEAGSLAWTLRGRWQCSSCGHRPVAFSWRCASCRRWATVRIETGIEPPPKAPRERRANPRLARPDGLLGAPPDSSLPSPTLDPGLSADELAHAGTHRSLLDRVGGWFKR